MKKIGFCGAGPMAIPMVLRMLKAGHAVNVWNRSREKIAPLVEAGAVATKTPSDMADCAVVFLCVFDSHAVESIVFGPSGLAQLQGASVLVDHSTIDPSLTRSFATRLKDANGMRWIDAPVTGGSTGAAEGSLVVFAGGSEADVALVSPMIRAYAGTVHHVGPSGAGQSTKLCNQAIAATTLVAIAEAIIFAEKSGIDSSQLARILAGGWGDSALLQTFGPRMTSRPSKIIGTVSTMLKDLDVVASQSQILKVPQPTVSAAHQTLRLAVANQLGDEDLSQFIRLLRGNIGLPPTHREGDQS